MTNLQTVRAARANRDIVRAAAMRVLRHGDSQQTAAGIVRAMFAAKASLLAQVAG